MFDYKSIFGLTKRYINEEEIMRKKIV